MGVSQPFRWWLGLTCAGLALAVLASVGPAAAQQDGAAAAEDIQVEEIAPRFHLVSEADANILLFAGEDMSVVVGVQRPALVARTRGLIDTLGAPPVRYALMTEDETAPAWGDGGWGKDGTITLAHELLYLRMMQIQAKGSRGKPGGYFVFPIMSFSQVVQVYPKGEEIHFIRERRGYTDADVITHFEYEGVLYLGNILTTDGYPTIDISRKGSLAGMITTVEFFLREFGGNLPKVEPIVPGRGPVATLKDLREYRRMLVTIRDRVQALVHAGRTLDEVIAEKPSADFDERWGRGPVSPDRFVAMVFKSPY